MKMKTPLLATIGILVLVGIFFLLKPPTAKTPVMTPQEKVSQAPADTAKVFAVTIKDKKIVSGQETFTVNEGDTVTISVTADEEEEVHVHGYDKSVDLEPNEQATLSFTANLSGRFPIELEHSKTDIAVLEVQPK